MTSSLAAQRARRRRPVHGTPCSIGEIYRSLSPEDQAEMDDWLYGDDPWTQPEIFEALTAAGYKPKLQMINQHRRAICRCAQDYGHTAQAAA